MNPAHKQKLADKQAKRYKAICEEVATYRKNGMKEEYGTYLFAAVEKRKAMGDKLVKLDGNYNRKDAILGATL
jgi:hypothetical protein